MKNGSLLNPISLRVGHFTHWEDLWYLRFQYYPEFLHSILKIKFFLVYYLTSKKFENLGYIYSHFEIIKKYKNIVIRCFLYYGKLEEILDNFFMENYHILKFKNAASISTGEKIYKKIPSWFTSFLKFYFVFRFYNVSLNFDSANKILKFFYILKKLNFYFLFKFLKSNENLTIPEKKNFFLFFSIYKMLYKITYDTYINKDESLNLISKKFLCSVFDTYTSILYLEWYLTY